MYLFFKKKLFGRLKIFQVKESINFVTVIQNFIACNQKVSLYLIYENY